MAAWVIRQSSAHKKVELTQTYILLRFSETPLVHAILTFPNTNQMQALIFKFVSIARSFA